MTDKFCRHCQKPLCRRAGERSDTFAKRSHCDNHCQNRRRNALAVAAFRHRALTNYEVLEAGCWIWKGAKNDSGYGVVSPNRKIMGAHRFFYEEHVGPIPDGSLLRHSCDTPACVNPAHLSLGSHADNKSDSVAKGRHAFGERMGSAKLNPAAVVAIRADDRSLTAIGRDYGVAAITIRKIKQRETWRHVE